MTGYKLGLFFIISIAGCLAVPLPENGSRIVGGAVAANGSHPHMAALVMGGIWREIFCGGAVVSQRAILTAAHCIDGIYSWGSLSRQASVVVGTNQWRPRTEGQQYELARNVTHPHWDRRINHNHDIGILFTRTNIVFSARVQPISLSWDFVDADVAVRAAGWGDTSHGGWISELLLELHLHTIEGDKCIQQVAEAGVIHDIRLPAVDPEFQMCVNHPLSDGHGMCHGDSGSALVRVGDGKLVGVVSWGVPCGRDAPDVFVRVSAYKDWLSRHIA
ncbi:trypsin domain-containing protein [Phthorimaea operculella]|nr:trypsin domain-containing protein [Phthorimaea operculella]